jgi:hypothetical protein
VQAKFVILFSADCIFEYFFLESRFDLFLLLHHLWMGFMSELLGLSHEPSSGNTANTSAHAMAKATIPSSAFQTSEAGCYQFILAHIMNFNFPEPESLFLRSLRSRIHEAENVKGTSMS